MSRQAPQAGASEKKPEPGDAAKARAKYVALHNVTVPNPDWTPTSGGSRCLHAPPGTVVELDDDDAAGLVEAGSLQPASQEAEAVVQRVAFAKNEKARRLLEEQRKAEEHLAQFSVR